MKALGIDLSLAGSALALSDGTCCTFRPRAGADQHARRLHELRDRIGSRIKQERADVAVIEAYSHGGKGGPLVMIRLAELGGPIRIELFEADTPYVEISPTALKLFATGDGGASKDDMVAAARNLGGDVANDNEADSWLLRLAALQRYEPQLGLPQLTKSIAALPWPRLKERVP